jgi:hypothetical protein
MQAHYHLLRTIYDIVKNDPQPENYGCRPRELILRQFQEWSVIQEQLEMLEEEEMVVTEQQNTMIIRITSVGLQKIMQENDSVIKE